MSTLIQQIKERVSKMYQSVVEHFKADELVVKVYGLYNEELFVIPREDITSIEIEKGVISVIVDITTDILEDFCSNHMKEEPHFITRLDYWVNYEEPLYLHSVKLNEPVGILNSEKEISIKYNFSSHYVEEK